MSHSGTTKAIFYAFSANLGIALTKTFAALWTGSGSLLAEAVHSYADCGNQVLLFIGMQRSDKQATGKHPLGYGRETYIWSMMVAFTLFSVGGVFSIHEGWQRYANPHELEYAGLALFILLAACGMEYFSLKGAMQAMREEQGERSLWQWFKETHSSELMVVIGEDFAAMLGLVIAFVMLALSAMTGDASYDALGSVFIGVLLVIVAFLIGKEVHSLLLGETAEPVKQDIQTALENEDSIVQVFNIIAINHGNSVMVSIKAEMNPELQVSDAVKEINRIEKQLKAQHERIQWVFFELDNAD